MSANLLNPYFIHNGTFKLQDCNILCCIMLIQSLMVVKHHKKLAMFLTVKHHLFFTNSPSRPEETRCCEGDVISFLSDIGFQLFFFFIS